MLALEPLEPGALLGPAQVRLRLLGESEVVSRLRAADCRLLAPGREAVGAVLLDRLKHPEARLATCLEPEQHALVDQGRDRLEEVRVDPAGSVHNGRRRVERATPDEHRQQPEQPLLVLGEQVVAPRDRVAQRPLPLGQITRTAGQKLETVLEPSDRGAPGRDEAPGAEPRLPRASSPERRALSLA